MKGRFFVLFVYFVVKWIDDHWPTGDSGNRKSISAACA